MRAAWACGLGCLLLAAGVQETPTKYFEPAALPEEIVPLYGEAATYRAMTTSDRKATLEFNLSSLLKNSKVDRVVVVPYDSQRWYEPVEAKLEGKTIRVALQLNRDILIALDLGEVARNNYRAVSEMGAIKAALPRQLLPRICQVILCPAERFNADRIPERLPGLKKLPIDLKGMFPPVPVGPIDRPATVCDRCLDRPVNILPCLVWRCEGIIPPFWRTRVRRNIYSLTPAQITSLRAGVAAMKAKSASDPTSWLYQARMHAVDSGVPATLQDQCQHRQFFFFSWHRMFIYYFERILRKASGDPTLNLPYWNYTDVLAQGVLPEAFRLPADSGNSLYDSTRQAVYNNGAALPAADVSYSAGFNLINFTTTTSGAPSFGGRTVSAPAHFPPGGGTGQIEFSPHNNVHNDIGGDMARGESPRDPIFWLHHANIDRLWNRWIALGNGRTNPTTDTVWMSQTFTFFDENGAQVSLTGSQVLNTVAQLGYRYDDQPWWPFAIAKQLRVERRIIGTDVLAEVKQVVRLTKSRQDVAIPLPPKQVESLAKSREKKFERESLILQLKDVQYDAPVGLTYMLFFNLPEGRPNPDHTDPSFIGTLGFFGKTEHGHGGGEGVTRDLDVTKVVQNLKDISVLRLSVVPSYPGVSAERKDLQKMVAEMKPEGNPRFSQIVLLRLRYESDR